MFVSLYILFIFPKIKCSSTPTLFSYNTTFKSTSEVLFCMKLFNGCYFATFSSASLDRNSV